MGTMLMKKLKSFEGDATREFLMVWAETLIYHKGLNKFNSKAVVLDERLHTIKSFQKCLSNS